MPREIENYQFNSDTTTEDEFLNVLDKYLSGEMGGQDFQRYISKRDLGEGHDDAQKAYSRFFQRTGKRIVGLPNTIVEAAKGGFGTKHLLDLMDKHGEAAGLGAWLLEIAHGSTVGMAILAKELALGHGDLIDLVEIGATVLPATRAISGLKVARTIKGIKNADPTLRARLLTEAYQNTMQKAVDAAARGDTTPINFQRYKLGGKDGIEITPDEFAYLQNAGVIDKQLGRIENIAEGIEILFNPDEVLQTAAWAGSLRGINALLRRGDTTEFTDQVTPQQGQSVGPVPQGTPPTGDAGLGAVQLGLPGAGAQSQQQTQPQALPGTTVQPGQTIITPSPAQPVDPSVPSGQAAGWGYTPQQVGTPTANIPQQQTPAAAAGIAQGQATGWEGQGIEQPVQPVQPAPQITPPETPQTPTVPPQGGVPPISPPEPPETPRSPQPAPHVPSITPLAPPETPQNVPPTDLPQPQVAPPAPETPQALATQGGIDIPDPNQTAVQANQLAQMARLEAELPGLPHDQKAREKIWNSVVGMGENAEFGLAFDREIIASHLTNDPIVPYMRNELNNPSYIFTPEDLRARGGKLKLTKNQSQLLANFMNRQSVVEFQGIDFESGGNIGQDVTGTANYRMRTADDAFDINISVTPTPLTNNGARVEFSTEDGSVQETYDIDDIGNVEVNDPRTVALARALDIYNNTKTTILEGDIQASMVKAHKNAYVTYTKSANGTAWFDAQTNTNIQVEVKQVGVDRYDIKVVQKGDNLTSKVLYEATSVLIDSKRANSNRHNYIEMADQALVDAFGVPQKRSTYKNSREKTVHVYYADDGKGSYYTIEVVDAPGKRRDVKLAKSWHRPIDLTITAKSFDAAAMKAVPATRSEWLKDNPSISTTTTPPTETPVTAPPQSELGRVIPAGNVDNQFYWRNPDNPEDVILFETELVETLNADNITRQVYNEVLNDRRMKTSLKQQIMQFVQAQKYQSAMIPDILQGLTSAFGDALAKTHLQNIQMWRKALRGDTEIHRVSATRNGFKPRRNKMYVNPTNNTKISQLDSYVKNTTWESDPDYVRPKQEAIDASTEALTEALDDAYDLAAVNFPITYGEDVPADVPDIQHQVGDATVTERLLGIGQSLVSGQRVNFIGRTIRSPQEMMMHAQLARDSRIETKYMVYVDAAGVVISDDIISSGLPGSITQSFKYVTGQLIEKIKNNPDIAKVYTFHNHPSGNATPSIEDTISERRWFNELEQAGLADRWGGSATINGGHFSFWKDNHHYLLNQSLAPEERGWHDDPLSTPTIVDDRVKEIMGRNIRQVWDQVSDLKHGSGAMTFVGIRIPHQAVRNLNEPIEYITNSAWTLNNLDQVADADIPKVVDLVMERLRFHGGKMVFGFFDDPNINPKLVKAINTKLGIQLYSTLPHDARPAFTFDASVERISLSYLTPTWEERANQKTNYALRRGEPNWYERFDDLTNRRLVDPRNGFSPQIADPSAFANQLDRLKAQATKLASYLKPPIFDTVVAMNMARLAGITAGDHVMVLNQTVDVDGSDKTINESLLPMAALRRQEDTGDVILSNNVTVTPHFTQQGFEKLGIEKPNVMLITAGVRPDFLENTLSYLHEDGRAILFVDRNADPILHGMTSRGEVHAVFRDYNVRAILTGDDVTSGAYIVIDKKKNGSSYVEKGELNDHLESVRNTRQPIDYRNAEQLALETARGEIVSEPSLSESVGKGRVPRGVGEPDEALYLNPTEPGEPVEYLLTDSEQTHRPVDSITGTGGLPAIPASVDAVGGSPVSHQAAQAGVNSGGVGSPTPTAFGDTPAMAGTGVRAADGLRAGHVPIGQGSPGMDTGLQQSGYTETGDIASVREISERDAQSDTASAEHQPRRVIQETQYGKQNTITGGAEPIVSAEPTPSRDRTMVIERGKRLLNRKRWGEVHERFMKSPTPYTFWQTGKRSLQRMGSNGIAILNNILKIDDNAKQLNGQFEILLRNAHSEINRLFKADIKALGGVKGKEWIDSELVAALQRERAVHPDIQRVADNIREFMDENFSQPMINMNLDILGAGIIGDLPVDWVNGSGRDLLHRKRGKVKAYNQESPLFGKFLQQTRNVTHFLFDSENQHIYAVVHQRRTGTRKGQLQQFDDYRLISPLGDEHRISSPESTGFQVIASVQDGVWTGTMDGAERVWNAEVQNTPDVQALRAAFEDHGITLPDEIRFKYKQFGEIDEWSVQDAEGDELYRLRYLNANPEGTMSSNPNYDPFRHRLMIYDANPRDPIMIYHGENAAHLWEPLDNYYPHMLNWNDLDFDAVELDNRTLDYAVRFWHANEDKIDSLSQAIEILQRESMRAKGRKYGHLEQARRFDYPDYDRRFFEVLQHFSNRASERQHVIANFGQNNDILQNQLDRLIAPTELRDAMTPELQAIMKLRYAQGYRDFTMNKFVQRSGNAFMPDDEPAVIDPNGDKYRRLTANDWQALFGANILRQDAQGNYVVVPEMLHMLETPAFANDAMKQGFINYSIAADVIANQFGHPTMSIFEEEINNVSRAIREASGLFLMKAYATQLGQGANTVALVGAQHTLHAIWDFTRESVANLGRRLKGERLQPLAIEEFSDAVGATIVDATEWHRSDTSLTSAMLGPRTDFHYKGTGLKEWVKNRAATPFMHAEKLNRWIAASAGKRYVMDNLKKLVDTPNNAIVRAKLDTLVPYGTHLAEQLNATLSTTVASQGGRGLTTADIDWVMEQSPDRIREQRPELKVVRDYIHSAAKTVSDVTQHRLGSADKAQMFQNPIVKAVFSLNSFNIKQTEFTKNLLAREASIYKAYVDEYPHNKAIAIARATGGVGLSMIPRFWGAVGFGAMAIGAGHLIRFKGFDEDDLTIMAALGQVGMAGYVNELYNASQYPRGLHGISIPPIVGAAFDATRAPLKTLGRFQLPLGKPFGEWGGEE